jgi:hypothetical protein
MIKRRNIASNLATQLYKRESQVLGDTALIFAAYILIVLDNQHLVSFPALSMAVSVSDFGAWVVSIFI